MDISVFVDSLMVPCRSYQSLSKGVAEPEFRRAVEGALQLGLFDLMLPIDGGAEVIERGVTTRRLVVFVFMG